MKQPPTYVPREKVNPTNAELPYGSKKGKVFWLNNKSHMIHPESDWEVYPEGELEPQAEMKRIKREAGRVEDMINMSVELDLSPIQEGTSEPEIKKAIASNYKALSNILFNAVQESEEKQQKGDALGGVDK